jgi:hypothetical protein
MFFPTSRFTFYSKTLVFSFLILIANSSTNHCFASQISIETVQGSFSYRLAKDPRKPGCLHKENPEIDDQFELSKIVALCIPSNSEILIKGCPDRNGKSISRPFSGPIEFRIIDECGESPPLGDEFLPGGWNSSIPYIISPRYTKILESPSVFRWNSIGSQAKYEVRLKKIDNSGNRTLLWNKTQESLQLSNDEVVSMSYPNDEKLLQPGDYELIIVSSNKDSLMEQEPQTYSSPDGILGRRFTLVDKEGASKIQTGVKILKKARNSSSQEIANFYVKNGFYANAIQELEDDLTQNKVSQISIYQALGNLYQRIGLNSLAAKNYIRANDNESLVKLCEKFRSNKKLLDCSALPRRAN